MNIRANAALSSALCCSMASYAGITSALDSGTTGPAGDDDPMCIRENAASSLDRCCSSNRSCNADSREGVEVRDMVVFGLVWERVKLIDSGILRMNR